LQKDNCKKGEGSKPFPFFDRPYFTVRSICLTSFFLPLSSPYRVPFPALRPAVRPVLFHPQEESLVQSAPELMELEPAEAEAVEPVLLSYRILLK
jgi:hypothetical protein